MIFSWNKFECKKMIDFFTVDNIDIDRQEKIRGFKMPWARKIKLYHEERDGTCFFPLGVFGNKLEANEFLYHHFKLDFPEFNYTGSPTEEQAEILSRVSTTRTGIIEMKTARGKSHVVMQIVNHFREPTLICCHNLKTLQEMVTKFKEFCGVDIGVYCGSKKKIKSITVTTHQSFTQKWGEFESMFGQIIVDECDCNFSPSMIEALCKVDVDAVRGLTGTPVRQEISTEDYQLIYGNIIKVENQENNGYNIIPEIKQIKYYHTSNFSFSSFHELKDMLIGDQKRVEKMIEVLTDAIEKGETKYPLVLVERREAESELFYQILSQTQKIKTILINGDTKIKQDDAGIKEITDAGTGIIIGTLKKMGRGVDIPMIDSVFVYFPNRFHSAVVQAVGRALRKFPGKEKVTVYDWADLPILKGQAKERETVYKQEYPGCFISSVTIKNE